MTNDEKMKNLIDWLSYFTKRTIYKSRKENCGYKDYELDLLDMFESVDKEAYKKAYDEAINKLVMEYDND